ncbi:MAG: DAK2 domain-containing protein, partial [Proteobacteria bacterium]|nr:DAK2 domain-containing protein [Pseudomonadota bacterium]
GAESTKEFVALKGRASYVGERSLGFPDAGAVAIAVILQDILNKVF